MNMIMLLRIFAVCAFVVVSMAGAHAGSAGYGNIFAILPHNFGPDGQFFFQTDGVRSGTPACGTVNRWVIKNAGAGKMQISVLMAAKVMNKRISIAGNGLCDVWSDTETVMYFVIED
jgi:hypothetical protein